MRGWLVAALLTFAVAGGTLLRLTPCLRHPAFEFIADGRYHERLTGEVVAAGALAAVDPLCNAGAGRRTADHLPLGLYFSGAAAHRGLAALGSRDLRWNLAWTSAFAGALIALPAAFGAYALFRDRRVAVIAGLIAVLLPAHFHRTSGIALRYDALGTLLVTTHVALVLAALAETRALRRRLFAAGAAVAFVLAMGVWRVSLLAVQLDLAAAALLFLVRGPDAAMRDLWIAMAVLGTLGLVPIHYLQEHRFLLSPFWLAVIGFAVVAAVPWPARARGRLARLVLLVAVAGLAAGLGRIDQASDYAGFTGLLEQRFGLERTHDASAALMSTVLELQGLSVGRLLASPEAFGGLGLVFVISPLFFAWMNGRRPGAPAVTFGVLALGFVISALLFQRGVVLLAPLVAIATAGVFVRLASPPRAVMPRAMRVVLASVVAGLALGMLVSVVRGALGERAQLAPNLVAAIDSIGTWSKADAVVLADWDAGYEIQSRTGRATVVDGLLESTENRTRIIDFYAALMSRDSEALEALCRSHRASWVLLPNSSAIYAMAAVTDDPLAAVIQRGEAVPRGPLTDHLVVHLIEGQPAYPGLRRALESGGFTVFEVIEAKP